jgi:alpha-mannosidase
MERFPNEVPAGAAGRMDQAWKAVLFNQFHDTLAGTSIAPAYDDARDEVGGGRAAAREIMVDITRRRAVVQPADAHQRLVLQNTGGRHFKGLVELEPWLGAEAHTLPVLLYSADNRQLPVQKMPGHAAEQKMFRYLTPVDLGPYAGTVLRVKHEQPSGIVPRVKAAERGLGNDKVEVTLGETGIAGISLGGKSILGGDGIRVTVQADPSNTWGDGPGAPFFNGLLKGVFRVVRGWDVLAAGPLRAVCAAELEWERSRCYLQVMVDMGDPCVRLDLRLVYGGAYEIVKLVASSAFTVEQRQDGIPGGAIARPLDGAEYPVHDHMSVAGGGLNLAFVSTDGYSGDVQADGTMRFTLLRSPCFVHNGNFPGGIPDPRIYPLSGQGSHDYRITVIPGAGDLAGAIADEAYRLTDPVWMSECTAGMRPRHHPGM